MLSIWDSKGVFFVIRHKENLKFETLQERELPPKELKASKDEEIVLSNPLSKEKYPKNLKEWLFGIMKTNKPLKWFPIISLGLLLP